MKKAGKIFLYIDKLFNLALKKNNQKHKKGTNKQK